MGNSFSAEKIPNLSNKTYVITGANTGIGYETALHIAKNHGKCILACRSEEKTQTAIKKMKEDIRKLDPTRNESTIQLEFLSFDLNSLESVVQAANQLIQRSIQIDCLINNAGIMTCPFALTKDGVESQFGVNHLGHFVFTLLVLPLIPKKGRIVNLTSTAQFYGYNEGLLDLECFKDTEKAKHMYSNLKAYGQSKLANVLFTMRLAHLKPLIYINCVHPGVVNTELGRHLEESYGKLVSKTIEYVGPWIFKTPLQGALTTLFVATSPDCLFTGKFFRPIAKLGTPSHLSQEHALQTKLFDISFQLVQDALGADLVSKLKKNLEPTY